MKTTRKAAKKRPTSKPAGRDGVANELQRRCERLERDRRNLRRELKEVTTERDQFRRSLIAAMNELHPPGPPPTWEEVEAQLGKLPPFAEAIDQLEAELKLEAKK